MGIVMEDVSELAVFVKNLTIIGKESLQPAEIAAQKRSRHSI